MDWIVTYTLDGGVTKVDIEVTAPSFTRAIMAAATQIPVECFRGKADKCAIISVKSKNYVEKCHK